MTTLIPFPAQSLPSQVPTGFDHQIERIRDLVMEASGLASREEMIAMARIMGMAAADGTIISDGESDNARLIEMTAFHVRRQDKTLIQLLLERMPIATDPRDRAILSALATSGWSIYRIDAIQPQVGAMVEDHWLKTRQVLYSRSFQNGLKVGDSIMARRVAVGELATMTALISKMSEPILDALQRTPGFTRDDNPMHDQHNQDQLAEGVFKKRPSSAQRSGAGTAASYGAGGGNRNRNQPCPCGSGKKFKHCCARG